jgi:hypothetical protein
MPAFETKNNTPFGTIEIFSDIVRLNFIDIWAISRVIAGALH